MQLTHPFQKLCRLSPHFLVVAAGSHLYGVDVTSGDIRWQHPSLPLAQSSPTAANGEHENDSSMLQTEGTDTSAIAPPTATTDEPASKRRKVESSSDANATQVAASSRTSSQDSISITTERRKGERRRPKPPPPANLPPANISHVLSAQDGKALVVITAEDKAISVYDVVADGLERRSRRVMPKRLCAAAVVVRTGREWLVVGDKFGDVWEVPVEEDLGWVPRREDENSAGGGGVGNGQSNGSGAVGGGGAGAGGGYEPSATDLTVHTKRNLMALQQQKLLKEKRLQKAQAAGGQGKDEETGKGPGVEFEGRLLLGHVSLLTDVVVVSVAGPNAENGKRTRRSYVLTSDRDEHVRVSRYPQSHVIEGYCLGMKEFVSRVRVVEWREEWLVVGTGEPTLRVYDWRAGTCLGVEAFDGELLRSEIDAAVSRGEDREGKLAVSGIWPVRVGDDGLVLVALEGLPLLFSYTISNQGQPIHHQTLHLDGNLLDVVVASDDPAIVVSIDTAHVPGSMQTYKDPSALEVSPLPAFELQQDGNSKQWQPAAQVAETLRKGMAQIGDGQPSTELVGGGGGRQGGRKGSYSPLGELLYGLENLRKRRDLGAHEAEEEDVLMEGEVEGLPEA